MAVGSWRLVAVGGWQLAVGGPWGLSLTKKGGGGLERPMRLYFRVKKKTKPRE